MTSHELHLLAQDIDRFLAEHPGEVGHNLAHARQFQLVIRNTQTRAERREVA